MHNGRENVDNKYGYFRCNTNKLIRCVSRVGILTSNLQEELYDNSVTEGHQGFIAFSVYSL